MVDCLKDYIGVEGCSGTTPASGLYINQLPGISLKMISSLANDDQQTFSGVWDDVQERAVRRFARDFRSQMSKRYKIKSMNQTVQTPRIIDTSTTTSASAQYRGMVIELSGDGDNYGCSNMQRIYLQSVRFYATSQNDIVVDVFNLDTGERLSTTTLASASVTANAWNTVNLYEYYDDADRIYVAVNCTNFDTVDHDIGDLRSGMWVESCYLDINGATSTYQSTVTDTDLTQGTKAFGVAPIFTVECSFDRLICRNLKIVETAWWYCLGIELMDERIFSDRLNEYTLFDRDTAMDNRKLFMIQYQGGLIDDVQQRGELELLVDGINLNTNDICIECNAPSNFVSGVSV